MRRLNLFLFVFTLLVAGMTLTATAANSSSYSNQTPTETDSVWVKGDALITNASQITANTTQSGFPTSNLLRPESDGYGNNQYIWHTSWGNPPVPPRGTDTYLQVKFNTPQRNIIFSMIGSTWIATYDMSQM